MKILATDNNTNFKSGLTNKILFKEKHINTGRQTKIFANRYGIEANFLENKSAALANKLCMDIFKELAVKFNLTIAPPPAIFIYEPQNIVDNTSPANFCIPDTKEVLKNEDPFAGRSIFFENFDNLELINNATEYSFNDKISSSPHFLAPFIHEWLHCFQLDHIYKNFGYGGNCEYLKSIYPDKNTSINGIQLIKDLQTKTLTDKENEIIFDNLGEYATRPFNQYLEIFSEAFSQLICNSLDKGKLTKSPLDELNKKSPEFQKLLRKICRFE